MYLGVIMKTINEFNGICVGDTVTINNNCYECLAPSSYPTIFRAEHLGRKGKVIQITDDITPIICVEYYGWPSLHWLHKSECLTVQGFNPKNIISYLFKSRSVWSKDDIN